MVILLINHYAGVGEMEHRPSYMAREWVRRGHHVIIVAASFSHLRGRNPRMVGRSRRERIEGVEYLWIKTPRYTGNGIPRALNIFAFVIRLAWLRKAIASEYRPDVVIASSTYPLDIYPASKIARHVGAKLVFEVHDLWPLTLIEIGGFSRRHPLIALMQRAEDFAYAHADRVVSILPNAETYMRSRGMAAAKFIHIPNGVDLSEWSDSPEALPDEHRRVLEDLKAAGKFVVGYTGAHGMANALGTILEAAKKLRGEPLSFVLVGRGPEKAVLQDAAAAQRLDNVVFLPPVPKAMIPALLGEMDALYLGLKDESLFRFGVCPNKLIDYMMAGKPVIQAINASNDLVSEAGCGCSIPAEDPDALRGAVLRLMSLTSIERAELGRKGRAFVRARHDYSVLAEQFLASLT